VAIRDVDKTRFELALRKTLSPTTPIRSPQLLRGRDKLLEDIRRAFVQPGRHVFIHGDRGVGKTSLAQTAALQQKPSGPILLGCDNASTFYQIATNLTQKLLPTDPTVRKTTTTAKGGIGWRALSVEAQKTIERGAIPEFRSIDDVVSAVSFLAGRHTSEPIVVIDEFERMVAPAQRMLFADFIKQVGDQSVPIKLIFCGIGHALGDLLDSHHSCYRYLAAIPDGGGYFAVSNCTDQRRFPALRPSADRKALVAGV
jgi:Cdc6-like AAA superfamily ATPase